MKDVEFIFVDRRTDADTGRPMFCPVCKFALRTQDDRLTYDSKKCCYKCALVFADQRMEMWKDGWRPTAEEVATEVNKRLQIPVSVDLSLLRDS